MIQKIALLVGIYQATCLVDSLICEKNVSNYGAILNKNYLTWSLKMHCKIVIVMIMMMTMTTDDGPYFGSD